MSRDGSPWRGCRGSGVRREGPGGASALSKDAPAHRGPQRDHEIPQPAAWWTDAEATTPATVRVPGCPSILRPTRGPSGASRGRLPELLAPRWIPEGPGASEPVDPLMEVCCS